MNRINNSSLHKASKKPFLIRLSLILFLISPILGCDETSEAPSGLTAQILNSNFDAQNNSGRPADWFVDGKVEGKGLIESIEQGNNSLLRLTPNAQNSGNDLLGVGQMLNAKMYRGQTLNIQAKLGAEDGANAVVGVHILGDGSDLEYVQFNQGSSDGKLVMHTDSLYVSEKAKNIIVYAIVNTTKGVAFFDDISFEKDGSASSTTVPIVSGKGEATISINTNQSIRQVPADIFGTNVEWIHNGQGLWSEKSKVISRQATKIAKESGFKLLRFPGGVFSDYYDWRDGIGSRDQRKTSKHYPNGPSSVHNFGSDELIDFADAIDANLLITVNVGHGSAELAANWVKYLNQQKSQNVTWWEIGNELYMDGDLSGAELNAREYAAEFKKFASAMKSVDSSIKLGAIGGLNYGRYAFIKDSDWTEDVLERIADDVDFLAVHNAYAPVLMGGGENADPLSVYKTMLAAPINIQENLKDLDKMLSEYDNSKRNIKIAITEWGPFFHILPSSKWVDHIKTLGSSLFVGSTLHTFMRAPRVEIANAFKISDHGFMGWIGNKGEEFRTTALTQVFSLYQESINGTVVATEVNSDTYDARSLGVINSVDDIPYIDAISVVKNNQLQIYVVNKSFDQTISTSLSIQSAKAYSSFSAVTISGSAIDAHTGTELPSFPGLVWADQVNVARFDKGAPSEITTSIENGEVDKAENGVQTATYSFKPMSVTRLTLTY